MEDFPEIRYILGPPRSGTSAFQRALCEISGQQGMYEPLRYEQHWKYRLESRVLRSYKDDRCHPLLRENFGRPHILKDVLGHNLLEEADKVFVDGVVNRSRPVFLFRDPVKATNSLKKVDWYPVSYFVESYERGYRLFQDMKAKGLPVMCLTHEEVTSDKSQDLLGMICKSWDIACDKDSSQWSDDYFDLVYYEKEQKDEIEKSGSHASLISSQGLTKKFNDAGQIILTNKEKKLVMDKLQPLYEDIQNSSISLSLKP